MSERIALYNADCLSTMRAMDANSIDCIVTDPPFGVDFKNNIFDDSNKLVSSQIDNWLTEMARVLKPSCHCYIYIPTKEAALWLSSIDKHFTLMNIISTRNYTTQNYTKNNYQFNTQLIAYCVKGKAKPLNEVDFITTSDSWLKDSRNKNPKPYTYSYPSFFPSNLFANTKGGKEDRHPCEKNTELLSILIRLSTQEGEIVLDPFLGGGSTGVAAVSANRKFIGIEINEEYFATAKRKVMENE